MKILHTILIPSDTTVGELANSIYPDITFDHSVPQGWLDAIAEETGVYLAGQVVWGYPPQFKLFGCPLPLTIEAVDIIARHSGLAESEGSHPMDPWMAIVAPRMDRTA